MEMPGSMMAQEAYRDWEASGRSSSRWTSRSTASFRVTSTVYDCRSV